MNEFPQVVPPEYWKWFWPDGTGDQAYARWCSLTTEEQAKARAAATEAFARLDIPART